MFGRWRTGLLLLAIACVPTGVRGAAPRSELLVDTIDVMPGTCVPVATPTIASTPPTRGHAAAPKTPPAAARVAWTSLAWARPAPPVPPPRAPRPVPLEAILPPPPPEIPGWAISGRPRKPGDRHLCDEQG